MNVTPSQRIQAAALREFLKTATVDQYARLDRRGMALIRRVPELSQLAEKRGLAAGLAAKYGFGAGHAPKR